MTSSGQVMHQTELLFLFLKGDLSTISTQLGFDIKDDLVTVTDEENGSQKIGQSEDKKESIEKSGIFSTADLTKFADLNLSGTVSQTPNKKKISKQDFLNAKKGLNQDTTNPDDPLSQLDPLWSLK